MNGIEQLCPNCGLCCDSTLFADVELQAGDQPARLKELGLMLEKKALRAGKNLKHAGRRPAVRLAFAQPCACFDGKLCKIYNDRPKRCGLFECGLLKRVEAEEMTAGTALKTISEAKRRAGKVRDLLRSLGQRDERMALTHRYSEVMSGPMDLTVEGEAEKRGELMMAVNDLMNRLQRDFLS